MKFIEKDESAPAVVEYEEELRKAQLDKDSLVDSSVHPSCQGPDIYNEVQSLAGFNALKNQLFNDQGGICCYCGRKLSYPNHPQYIVEHVKPKNIYRELAGEYMNLLLSCRPSKEEEERRRNAPKSVRKSFFHCDKSKESQELNYTPLQSDCGKHYTFAPFTGEIRLRDEQDSKAEHDLRILNLNCEWLKRRRLAAIEGEIYDESGELLPDKELYERLHSVMQRDDAGMYGEYCFVIHDVLKQWLS